MKEKQFLKEIKKIQEFMGLDNWIITYNLLTIGADEDWQKANWQIENINYTYFRASISFDLSLLKDTYEDAIHVIFHELSHIYTSNTLQQFEDDDRDYLEHYIGASTYVEMKNKYNTTNEQQPEFLARRFKELYLLNK